MNQDWVCAWPTWESRSLKIKEETSIWCFHIHSCPTKHPKSTYWILFFVYELGFAQRCAHHGHIYRELEKQRWGKQERANVISTHSSSNEEAGLHSKVKGCSRRGMADLGSGWQCLVEVLCSPWHVLGNQSYRGNIAWWLKDMSFRVMSQASVLIIWGTFNKVLNLSVVWGPHPHKWRQLQSLLHQSFTERLEGVNTHQVLRKETYITISYNYTASSFY